MYAVTGSTGHVGNAVVRALLAQGQQVRALLRDPEKSDSLKALGAEPFIGSVEDSAQLEAGFRSVEGAFIMTPPFYQSQNSREEHLLALAAIKHALQAAHVPKFVMLSSIGAELEEGSGAILKLHDMEKELCPLRQPSVALRAAYFMQNLFPLIPHAKSTGELPVMYSPLDQKLAMVSTEDVGKVAAALLTEVPGEAGEGARIVELEGPAQYSMNDAAEALGKMLGRQIKPVLLPEAARQSAFESAGMTPNAAKEMIRMMEGFSKGLIQFGGGTGTEHRRGSTSLEQAFANA